MKVVLLFWLMAPLILVAPHLSWPQARKWALVCLVLFAVFALIEWRINK